MPARSPLPTPTAIAGMKGSSSSPAGATWSERSGCTTITSCTVVGLKSFRTLPALDPVLDRAVVPRTAEDHPRQDPTRDPGHDPGPRNRHVKPEPRVPGVRDEMQKICLTLISLLEVP